MKPRTFVPGFRDFLISVVDHKTIMTLYVYDGTMVNRAGHYIGERLIAADSVEVRLSGKRYGYDNEGNLIGWDIGVFLPGVELLLPFRVKRDG